MTVIDDLLPALQARLSRFNRQAKQAAPKQKGSLQASVRSEIRKSGPRLVVKASYNIYGLILHYMAFNGKRQARKKGGRVKGSKRLQGANTLADSSPLRRNPQKYQKLRAEEVQLREELEDLAVATILELTTDQILSNLTEE